jgi:sodium transport system permease protein
MRTLFTVFRKEFLENLRDRRTLLSALLFGPLFGPLLFGAMVTRILDQSAVESDQPVHLSISGGDRAPGLVRYLESHGVKLTKASLSESGARAAVRSGAAQVVLMVPEEYARRFAAAAPAPLLLIADSADSQTRKIADRARILLSNYGSGIAQLRLQVRGVNPLVALPVAVNDVDVATPAGRAVVVLGFMTYFVLFAVLVGGLYLAIDSTAGERERGSLEALLSLRLHVPVAGHQSHGFRLRISFRAARAAWHERESGFRHGAGVLRDLPALRASRRSLDDLRRLVHPQLPRGANLPDFRAPGTDAADRLCQHLFAQN